jgi:hypothetical protein
VSLEVAAAALVRPDNLRQVIQRVVLAVMEKQHSVVTLEFQIVMEM